VPYHSSYYLFDPLPHKRDESDLMLANGARYYIDHAHPEYSTPECLSPRVLVAADKAGERILAACQQRINQVGVLPLDQQIRVYKNNSDYKDSSYGCHENYLLSAEFFQRLQQPKVHPGFRALLPFLVTRTIVCGAGKIGAENSTVPTGFQLSQRADFFESLIGLQTTAHRPLFNTRDEPHADEQRLRRLHVIPGDANMAEFSTYLKVGTTQLLLHMLEDNFIKGELVLHSPIDAMRAVSRDLTFTLPLELADGRKMTALEIQEWYLDLAYRYLEERGGSDEQYAVLEAWDDVLSMLPDEWEKLATRLDWAIKRRFLERSVQAQGTDWETIAAWQAVIERAEQGEVARSLAQQHKLAWADFQRQRDLYFALRRLDLQYHDIRSDASQGEIGLFYHLQQRGAIERLVTDEEIAHLISSPPPETRAWFRGQCIGRFADQVVAADWNRLTFAQSHMPFHSHNQLELSDPRRGAEAAMAEIWPQLQNPSLALANWQAFAGQAEE
jgi:proteasome accessory factor A